VRYAVRLLQEQHQEVRQEVLGFLAAHPDDDGNCLLQIGPYSIAVAPDKPQNVE
jgi:hypothetical protein